MAGIIDEAALDQRIREIARQEAQRPVLVNQRTVETFIGVPRRDYVRLARTDAFPTTRLGRLVVARTGDVLAYFTGRLLPGPAVADAEEATAFARVGARRVAPIDAKPRRQRA